MFRPTQGLRIAPILIVLMTLGSSLSTRNLAGSLGEWPLELRVETLRVGPSGTETLAADEARLLPGKAAVLTKEVTLSSSVSGNSGTEKLSIRAEIRVDSTSSGRLVMRVLSRVNVLATTGGIPIPRAEIRRELTADSLEGTSQLFEVYASPALKTKVTLNIRWFAGDAESGAPEEAVPIPLTARVYEMEGAEAVLLRENQLLAAPGGTASATFNRSVPLSEDKTGGKRIRQDRVELTLSPRFKVGKSLAMSLEVTGEVVTLTQEGEISRPVSRKEELILVSGVPATLVAEVVAEDPAKEGWEKVRFRLEVAATF